MKLFLEEETGTGENKTISILKTVKDKAEAIKDKTINTCYIHYCYHDEERPRPCKRERV